MLHTRLTSPRACILGPVLVGKSSESYSLKMHSQRCFRRSILLVVVHNCEYIPYIQLPLLVHHLKLHITNRFFVTSTGKVKV
jgi:hypothetical protein